MYIMDVMSYEDITIEKSLSEGRPPTSYHTGFILQHTSEQNSFLQYAISIQARRLKLRRNSGQVSKHA